jgi:hypothetical protein
MLTRLSEITPSPIQRCIPASLLYRQRHVTEAILNHVSGHKAGVAGVYNRARYENECRDALDRWASWIAGLTAEG